MFLTIFNCVNLCLYPYKGKKDYCRKVTSSYSIMEINQLSLYSFF